MSEKRARPNNGGGYSDAAVVVVIANKQVETDDQRRQISREGRWSGQRRVRSRGMDSPTLIRTPDHKKEARAEAEQGTGQQQE